MFQTTHIEQSPVDRKRGITFPSELSPSLAEFLGIMVGDGHLGFYNILNSNGKIRKQSELKISANKDETNYIHYVKKLFHFLFSTTLKVYTVNSTKEATLSFYSKGIVNYLNTCCEIPLNRKTDSVRIPRIVKDAPFNVQCAFLRGLADTDFSVSFKKKSIRGHTYPVIRGTFRSKLLVQDLEKMLTSLGFRCSTMYDERKFDKRRNGFDICHNIYLNGKDNLELWLDKIGFSNSKFQKKTKKWRTDGICPPGY